MLNIVCFKWSRPNKGVILPAQRLLEYGPRHVNTLYSMLTRHVHVPFRLICVTDNSTSIDHRVEVLPMWDDFRDMGGCYTRLKVFDRSMKNLFGDRFVCVDIDCVITGDLTPMLSRKEDIIINAYNPLFPHDPDQYYNGGLIMMNAGARQHVWDEFKADPALAHGQVLSGAVRRQCIGSDQAWMRLTLGKTEARFTNADGVFEARQFQHHIPKNARILFFAGKRDPSISALGWVRSNWR